MRINTNIITTSFGFVKNDLVLVLRLYGAKNSTVVLIHIGIDVFSQYLGFYDTK